MSEPINLNQYRKAKARADQKARADRNAVFFGRTKAQRIVEAAQKEKARKTLDHSKFEEPQE